MVQGLVVRPIATGERASVVGLLTAALADDPAWQHVLPVASQRRVALATMAGVAVRDSGAGVRVAFRGQDMVGAAVWQPPGRYPMTRLRELKALPHMLPLLRMGSPARDLQRFGQAVDTAFPTAPVRYLQILGVTPTAQRQGAGAGLIADGVATADRASEVVYLETGQEANVAYYESHGFHLVAPGAPIMPGGPVMWLLQREPARPS